LFLQKGDVIVRMNDYSGSTYEDFMAYMGTQPKHLSTQIVVEREVRPISCLLDAAMKEY